MKRKHRPIQKLEHAESQNVGPPCLVPQGEGLLSTPKADLQRLPGLLTGRPRTEQDFYYWTQSLDNWDPVSPLSWGPSAGSHGDSTEIMGSGKQGWVYPLKAPTQTVEFYLDYKQPLA